MHAPTGLVAFLKLMPVGEGLPPKKLTQNKREDNILPYNQNIEIRAKFCRDDILGIPFVRSNVTFGSRASGWRNLQNKRQCGW